MGQPLGSVSRPVRTTRSRNQEAFLRLALTHAAVMAGDAMVTVALAGSIFFSTSVNGARGRVLLSLVLTMAPFAVVAPFLGPAIDKSKGGRRMMVILSAAGRAAVCIYMARVVHNLLLFLPAALAVLILSKGHSIAKSALVPATVDSPDELVKAGGRLAVLAAIAGFAAGGLAALVVHFFGAGWALRLAALTYGVGAIMAIRTHPAPPAAPDPADHINERVRSIGVSLAAVAMASIRGVSGFLTFAIAFSFRRAKVPTWWFGIVLVGGLLGGFVGNLTGPRLRQVVREELIMIFALTSVAVSGFAVALIGPRLAITIVAVAVGFADGIGQLSFDAIVQRDGSEGARGRSFARYEAAFQFTWVAAAVLPVALPISTWQASLLLALSATAVVIYYSIGRYVAVRQRPPGEAPMRVSEPSSAQSNAAPPAPPPAWDAGVRWGEDMAPRPPGPRRNPNRP